MKATFFTLAALAASAFAAPTVDTTVEVVARNAAVQARDQVSDAVKIVDGVVVEDLGVGQIVDEATKSKRDLSGSDLETMLSSLLTKVKASTKSINATLASVQSGETSKSDGTDSVTSAIGDVHFQLTTVVTDLTGAAGIPVQDADVDKVLNLVVALVSELLVVVNSIVTILGITPQLTSLLHSVFGLVSNVVILLIGLVTGLLPGLVAGLSPLLATLGNGLLAPLLTPIAALVAGLAGQ